MPDVPSLSTMLDLRNNCLIFADNNLLWKLFLDKNVKVEVKLKTTVNKDSTAVKSVCIISEDRFFIYSGTSCIKYFEESRKEGKVLGYLCAYCLIIFSKSSTLLRAHMECQIGPASCDICKV